MKEFERLERDVIHRLKTELDPTLTYHSVKHTADVMRSTQRLAEQEEVSAEEKDLLKVAALLHDSGFLLSFEEHEAYGAKLAREILPDYGYESDEIEVVCRLIMATRVPQEPKDLLEYIICDADLDYLGRPDFFETGDRLFTEFKARGIVDDYCGWDRIQVKFLEYHRYFTATARATRSHQKAQHLVKIRERLAKCQPAT